MAVPLRECHIWSSTFQILLSSCKLIRSEFVLVSLLDIDKYIVETQNHLSPLPRADPSRPTYLATLAVARLARYELTDENEDLEESISRSFEAILSPNDSQIGSDSDVVTAFFFLADSLFRRSHKLKRPDDSKHCLRYFRCLRDQSLEIYPITRDHITTAFARAFSIGDQMESTDPTRNIKEMASLDASDGLLRSAAETLAKSIHGEPFSSDRPLPDQTIECLREANIRFPDLENVSLVLLFSLLHRFTVTHAHADYEDAVSIVDGSITDPVYVEMASIMVAVLALCRFAFYGNPEHLEEAIFRLRICLKTMSFGSPERQEVRQEMTRLLGRLEKDHLDEFSVASNSRVADAGNTDVINQPPSSHLVSPLPITRSGIDEVTSMTQDAEDLHLFGALLSRLFDQPIDLAGIEEASISKMSPARVTRVARVARSSCSSHSRPSLSLFSKSIHPTMRF